MIYKEQEVLLRIITADEGKTFANVDGNIIGEVIALGKEDDASNYIEVEKLMDQELDN